MRKFLMISVLAGSAALGLGATAEAAPLAGPFAAQPLEGAQVQTVQYGCGPRCREEIRRREWRRRHEERRYDERRYEGRRYDERRYDERRDEGRYDRRR